MTSPLTYLYCLVRSAKPPGLRGAPMGVPGGGPLRALDAGNGLWLIAADVPESAYGETAIAKGLQSLDWVSRRALGHEEVVEHFLNAPAVLPMQLFTIFTSDERALRHVLQQRARIGRVIARLSGQQEWGLRLTWDEQAVRQRVEEKYRAKRWPKPGASDESRLVTKHRRGTAYLARKRDLFDVSRTTLAAARTEATRLFRQMSKAATDARRRTSTEQAVRGSRVLLDAAYLVPVQRAGAFRRELRRHTRALESAGVVVSLTGPWPPYNFVRSRR